jgi:hypothetical protein
MTYNCSIYCQIYKLSHDNRLVQVAKLKKENAAERNFRIIY